MSNTETVPQTRFVIRKDTGTAYLSSLWESLTLGTCPDLVVCGEDSLDASQISLDKIIDRMRIGAVTITFDKLKECLVEEADKSEYIVLCAGSARKVMERLKIGAAGSFNPTTSRWATHLPRDHKIEIGPDNVVTLLRKRST